MRITVDQIRSLNHARQANADVNALIAGLKNEGRALLNVDRAKRDEARISAIEAEVNGLTSEAATIAEKMAEYERRAADERKLGTLNPDSQGSQVLQPMGSPIGRRYRDLFGHHGIADHGWASADEFLAAVHNSLNDHRLISTTRAGGLMATAVGNLGGDGGFSVPPEYAAQWLDASIESEIVRPRATIWPMASDTRNVPGWDALSSSSSRLYGGFTAQWVGETGTITEASPKMQMLALKARKLALLTQVSNELAADGVGYDRQLSSAMVRAMGWFMDDAFLNGTGAGQPLGVLNSTCLITVTKETGQAAGTIVYGNVAKMFARLHPSCVENSVWVASSTTIPYLLQLSIPLGTSGSFVPVLSQSGGSYTMLTRPVIFTEKVPAVGTLGDIGLYDFSQYAIGLRKDMSLDKSSHVGFTTDTAYYRGILRVDGQPIWRTVYTPKNGDTMSPFVVLQTRS
jgi:HK97 family phage major capsid protein